MGVSLLGSGVDDTRVADSDFLAGPRLPSEKKNMQPAARGRGLHAAGATGGGRRAVRGASRPP